MLQEMIGLVLEEIKVRETLLVTGSGGLTQPPLGVVEYKVGQCSVQFYDASDYNEHMSNMHGVTTSIQDLVQPSFKPSAPAYDSSARNGNPQDNQTIRVLGMLAPTLKASRKMVASIEVSKLRPNPGKKDMAEGLEELELVLISDGKYDGTNRIMSIEDFGHIVARMRELVDEANWVDMEGGYIQASGKTKKRPHALNLDHASEAIKGVINNKQGLEDL